MNFRQGNRDEPDINLIPFIDVLLVVLIFLVLTTTFSPFRALQVRLPVANSEQPQWEPGQIVVSIARDGSYSLNGRALKGRLVTDLTQSLQTLAVADDKGERPLLVIHADAAASHQSVINAMDAARRAGLERLTFATERARDE